ncbi:MAG TPA: fibronectin/fibrinogen-binding protein [Firmicutes bacterium]|nr:fibronectin/fibrinogen-binding protein [Candidatus Fermentithermobacillaceae bacterium]
MDGITFYAIRREIERYLPMRVQKIYQPEKGEVSFSLWNRVSKEQLVLSLKGNKPFFGFSDEKRENPKVPSGFCLGLRKRLEGGVLSRISQEGLDRVLYLFFTGHDDFGNPQEYMLVFDAAGKGANIALYRGNDLEISMELPSGDRICPGEPYTPPVQDRVNLTDDLPDGYIARHLLSQPGNVYAALSASLAGTGKDLVTSILSQAGFTGNEVLSEESARTLAAFLEDLSDRLRTGTFSPALYANKNGEPVFHVLPLTHLERKETFESVLDGVKRYRSLMLALDEYSSLRAKTTSLYRKILDKLESRYTAQKQDYDNAKDCDKYRIWAELIDASGKDGPRGLTEMTVLNYYADPPEEMIVPLDPALSPRENARAYYSKYGKLSRARKRLKESLEETEQEIERLRSLGKNLIRDDGQVREVDPFDERALRESIQEVTAFYSRLEKVALQSGLKVGRPLEKPRIKPQSDVSCARASRELRVQPENAPELEGYHVYVGRNARENDYLVTHVKRPGDIWLHAKGVKGAHVLLRPLSGNKVTPEAILYAAKIAAQNSEAKDSPKVEVDWVNAKNVKKPGDAPPGFVTYTGQKTVVVSCSPPGHTDQI